MVSGTPDFIGDGRGYIMKKKRDTWADWFTDTVDIRAIQTITQIPGYIDDTLITPTGTEVEIVDARLFDEPGFLGAIAIVKSKPLKPVATGYPDGYAYGLFIPYGQN